MRRHFKLSIQETTGLKNNHKVFVAINVPEGANENDVNEKAYIKSIKSLKNKNRYYYYLADIVEITSVEYKTIKNEYKQSNIFSQ